MGKVALVFAWSDSLRNSFVSQRSGIFWGFLFFVGGLSRIFWNFLGFLRFSENSKNSKEIEQKITVIPNARATAITMNRDKIRDLAANELNIRTAKFSYAMNQSELDIHAERIGYPLLIKPVMSSSGKGQSLVNNKNDLVQGWNLAIEKSRGKSNKIILEEFIDFDLEITLLTIRQFNGKTLFCEPIGHEQKNGDYQCSWQPATLTESVLDKAQKIAKCVTDNLGGVGLFGVEFFIKGEEVIFSELSPRPT